MSLICQHDAQGAMGLVLNQDSEFTLGALFDQLGMPKTKRTKTGYTTDADALADGKGLEDVGHGFFS